MRRRVVAVSGVSGVQLQLRLLSWGALVLEKVGPAAQMGDVCR